MNAACPPITFAQRATWVDSNFFSVFSFPLLSGNPATALADPQSVVLTEDMAKKYFGTTDAVGKTLKFEIDNTFKTFTVSGIAKRWHPFDHYFVHEKNNQEYDQEARWRQIITCSAILTIFISCIGLFGLALLSIRQRQKEIGVRKVLGAGVWQVVSLVSRNFVGLVFLAFLVAIPISW